MFSCWCQKAELAGIPDCRICTHARTHVHTSHVGAYALVLVYALLPLDEEGERAEEGGGEHEAVGDEDPDVHAIVERELDEDLQCREGELHHNHAHCWPRAAHGRRAAAAGPHATASSFSGARQACVSDRERTRPPIKHEQYK
jgi:hypothetical protein